MNMVDINANMTMLPRTRTRKLSLDNHTNNLLMDSNGNTRQFKRLSSLSELSFEDANDSVDTPENDLDLNENRGEKTPNLDTAVLKQIHCLIKNVQISDNLADYIGREVLGVNDVSISANQRTRRKSCFTLSGTLGNISEHTGAMTRRQSIASKATSLPRRKFSATGMPECPVVNPQSPQRQRRSSVAYINSGRRSSVASMSRSRRSSVQHSDGYVNTGQRSGRRNSVAYSNMARRSSLASAYTNSVLPRLRRMSSVQDNLGSAQVTVGPQRRRSSIKPPCFPVTKIASVQKRLNKLYRRRKRNERAQVNIRDVKTAFKELRKLENNGVSDSETNSDANCDVSDDVDNTMDDNSNVCLGSPGYEQCEADVETTVETCVNCLPMSSNSTQTDDNDNYIPVAGEVPAPRRKTSIQVRAWELSRRLRQRRRQNRKGFTESDLI